MNILVTGGAGYVGSVLSEELLGQGYRVIVIDNLQQGHHEAVPPGAEFVLADICHPEELDTVFQKYAIDAIMHMAAETIVEYSMTDPQRHFRSNVSGGMNILAAMLKHHVSRLIFSSSAAVYGEPQSTPVEEDQPKKPVNAYGESKLVFERILEWYARGYGISYVALRYFNAAGASPNLGEDHQPETHLIPNVLKAALSPGSPVSVFGTDYPTRDGSCVRDYLHVLDIAQAHLLALEKLAPLSGKAYNLGSEAGYSVLEIIGTARQVTGVEIATEVAPRRPGDPAVLVASSRLARQELGWAPVHSELDTIVDSAWQWLKKHPNGYGKP